MYLVITDYRNLSGRTSRGNELFKIPVLRSIYLFLLVSVNMVLAFKDPSVWF